MELSKLDLRAAADKGRFLQFKDPKSGAPLFDGETPIGAVILGVQSRAVQRAIADIWRSQMQADYDPAQKSAEDLQRDTVQSAVIVTAELQGVTINGEPIQQADFERFYDANFIDLDAALGKPGRVGSFAQQAWRFANDDFFPEA